METLDDYAVQKIIGWFQQQEDIDLELRSDIEFIYLPMLDDYSEVRPRALNTRLSLEPEYFCSLIELCYKERNGEKREIELNKSLSDRLYEILFQFKVIPGIDWNGNFDAKRFDYWMKTVKTWSRDNDRYEVAMHTVGSGLSYAELDEDKLPQTAVIEELNRVENGVDASAEMISHMTDRILPIAKEWQNRPLEKKYAIVFMDAIHFHVREDNRTVKKAVYVAIGIRLSGQKEVLGMWIGGNESAKYWLGVLNEIKNRGVEDIMIVSVDGLTGFVDAIHAVFPLAEIQRCIVHQIRYSTKFISYKDIRAFMKDLKLVYNSDSGDCRIESSESQRRIRAVSCRRLRRKCEWSRGNSRFCYLCNAEWKNDSPGGCAG